VQLFDNAASLVECNEQEVNVTCKIIHPAPLYKYYHWEMTVKCNSPSDTYFVSSHCFSLHRLWHGQGSHRLIVSAGQERGHADSSAGRQVFLPSFGVCESGVGRSELEGAGDEDARTVGGELHPYTRAVPVRPQSVALLPRRHW